MTASFKRKYDVVVTNTDQGYSVARQFNLRWSDAMREADRLRNKYGSVNGDYSVVVLPRKAGA